MTRYVKLIHNVSPILNLQWECFLTTVPRSNLIMKIAGKLQITQVRVTFRPLSKRYKSWRTRRNPSYTTRKKSPSATLPVSSIRITRSKFKFIATPSNLITFSRSVSSPNKISNIDFDPRIKLELLQERGLHDYQVHDSKVPQFQLNAGLIYSNADIKSKVGEAVKGFKDKIVSLVPNN